MIKSQDWPKGFLKKFLIPDYRGFKCQKIGFFDIFPETLLRYFFDILHDDRDQHHATFWPGIRSQKK